MISRLRSFSSRLALREEREVEAVFSDAYRHYAAWVLRIILHSSQTKEKNVRKFATFVFSVGLVALANVGFSNDGMASTHGQITGSLGQQANSMMAPGTTGSDLAMPPMDPARGRKLFASKGCMVCHSVNGVGGEDAPPLDAVNMPSPMNPFDFAASMWLGAEAMIFLQRDELGEQIEFTGGELADIIAFIHDPVEQKKFSEADAPIGIRALMRHIREEGDGEHEAEKPKD